MKIPHSITWYPLDVKKDTESKGLWVYIPEWIVRSYKLKPYGNMGKICFEIHRDNRAIYEYIKDMNLSHDLYYENWKNKLRRERKDKTI